MVLPLISVCVALFLVEIGLRFFSENLTPSINSVKTYSYHANVGIITARPNSTVIHRNPWVHNTVSYNDLGFRGNNWELDSIKDKLRIALLGDSYIEGREVKEGELISSVLGELLGDNTVVMNFGLSGSSQAEQLLIYKNLIRKFKPHIVIHFVTVSNDFEDNLGELSPNQNKIFLDIKNDDLVTIPLPKHVQIICSEGISWLTEKITNLKVFRLVYSFIETGKQLNKRQENNPDTEPAVTVKKTNLNKINDVQPPDIIKEKRADMTLSRFMTPKYESAKTVMKKALLYLRSECEKDGVTFILSHATACWTFMEDGDEIQRTRRNMVSERFSWLEKFAHKHGFHFYDLQESLVKHQHQKNLDSSDIHIPWDGHWTPLAHRIVAEKLHVYLNNSILPQIQVQKEREPVEVAH